MKRLVASIPWDAVGFAVFGCAVANIVQDATGSERDGNFAGLGAVVAAIGAVFAWRQRRKR